MFLYSYLSDGKTWVIPNPTERVREALSISTEFRGILLLTVSQSVSQSVSPSVLVLSPFVTTDQILVVVTQLRD